MGIFILFRLFLITSALSGSVIGKECTNTPTEISSHTVRYELLKSTNESWRKEVFSHYHPTPSDDSAWADLLPRKILRENEELNWGMLYQNIKYWDWSKGYQGERNFLTEVSLHEVRLEPNSVHWRAQQTNLKYLLMLDVDSLVWSFRKTAGLPTPGKPYGGWEKPDCELRGHFVGHYLSATAKMWASTHNDTVHKNMLAVVAALDACQKKMKTGYLSAFPSEEFDRVEAIKPVWAPYYTIHKILAGLLDQYLLAHNTQALKMVVWMVDYFYKRVQDVISKYSIERHWTMLNEETGGMNDILYNLYRITGNQKHLVLAHLFDKPCFLGLLAVQVDSLSNFHTNTHIPVVIGSQMRYEVTGDQLYKEIGTFFMDIINSSHVYATGGTSVSEFWRDPKRLATTLQTENEESCTTYNMLKVSRNLFRWTKEIAYADYYERALTNGVLSIQRGTDPGVMAYMLPLGHGVSKARSYHRWGTPFNSFWCCYGTAIESFSKLGDSIYFEEKDSVPGLYVIQFISSSLDWKSAQVVLNQKVEPVTSSDPYLRVSFTFSTKKGAGEQSTLYLRIPPWTYSIGARAALNAKALSLPSPGNFLSITNKWSSSDKVSLELPFGLRTESITDDRPEYAPLQAILFGPYVLAGFTNGDHEIETGSASSLSDHVTAIPVTYNSQLISLTQESDGEIRAFTNANNLIKMEKLDESGTDAALHATFRLISKDVTFSHFFSREDIIGKTVMLEPFDLPEMLVAHHGPHSKLAVKNGAGRDSDAQSIFSVVSGLDGKANTVSLESNSEQGCFIYSEVNHNVGLICQSSMASSREDFKNSVSFIMGKGMSNYHPISFMARGAKRNFILSPLLSLKDESYAVYFNIKA